VDAYDILPKLFSFGVYFLGLFIAYKVWDDFEYYKYLKKENWRYIWGGKIRFISAFFAIVWTYWFVGMSGYENIRDFLN
tara:strand:- start:10777 stop:11013 length:237 start_codon:yes stop_codon:yes gene_type:complete